MRRHGVQLTLWLVPIALAGIAGLSYVHPFNTIISRNDDTLYHVAISDGNLRIVGLSAHFVASYIGETPLDEQAQQWTTIPTELLAWDTNDSTLPD